MTNITVTTATDELDNVNGSGEVSIANFGGAEDISLREAVALANANVDLSTITFDISLADADIDVSQGVLLITDDIIIDGNLSDGDGVVDGVTIVGDGSSRIFDVTGGGTDATFESLSITGGDAGFSSGGAIRFLSSTTGSVNNSTLFGNNAGTGGGVAVSLGATVSVSNTTITENTARSGGGFFNFGTATVTNTTFVDNTASINGGAIVSNSNTTLTNITVTGNDAPSAGAIAVALGVTTITNSIVLGNGGTQFAGSFVNGGGNVLNGDVASIFASTGLGADGSTQAGRLADNGGAVQTVALLLDGDNSAIDAGNIVDGLLTDARGQLRDIDILGIDNGGTVDAGAFELETQLNALPQIISVPTDLMVIEDVLSAIDLSSISLSDADGDVLTVTLTVTAGSFVAPALGDDIGDGVVASLTDATTITLVGLAEDITAYLSDGSNIQYTGEENVNGDNVATLNITVDDEMSDIVMAAPINIDIMAVNDVPTLSNVPANVVGQSGESVDLDLSQIVFDDIEGDTLTITLTAQNAILSASAGTDDVNDDSADDAAGVTVTSVDPQTLTLTGSIEDLVAFLEDSSNIQLLIESGVNGEDAAAVSISVSDGALSTEEQLISVAVEEEDSLTVTISNDVVNAFDGETSLREAINFANSNADESEISFAADLAGATFTLSEGALTLSSDIIINGQLSLEDDVLVSEGDEVEEIEPAANITLSGGGASRVFTITGSGTEVSLGNLTIRDGESLGAGGAILIEEGATGSLVQVDITDNNAADGGAISNQGTLNIEESLIANNTATSSGGGIDNSGTATITTATFSANDAGLNGGGISNVSGGDLSLTNVTVFGNVAGVAGGGIDNNDIASLTHVTLSGNIASFGGAVNSTSEGLSFTNSLVAGNVVSEDGGEVLGTFTDNGGNVIGGEANNIFEFTVLIDPDGDEFTDNSFLAGMLTDNGGAVSTIQLLSDIANVALDTGSVIEGVSNDAAGQARENDLAGIDNGGTVDAGAFELIALVEEASLEVTTTLDSIDAFDGETSLREAVALANFIGGTNEITFAQELAGETVSLSEGVLEINSDLSINGDIVDNDNRSDIVIAGNGEERVFQITGAGVDVRFNALTITGGNAGFSSGGGVVVESGANLLIENTTITENIAATGAGIGVFLGGNATVLNSTIFNNNASAVGGGAFILGNAQFINTTITQNNANVSGGGLTNFGATSLTNVTVTGNVAADFGGINVEQGTVTLVNTLAVGNANGNVEGAIFDAGGNVISGDAGDIFATTTFAPDDETTTGLLADNGGSVETIALLNSADNAALDVGQVVGGLSSDSRGQARNIDIIGTNNGGTVDAGAFELQTQLNSVPIITGVPSDILVTEDVASDVDLSTIVLNDADGDILTVTLTLSAGSFLIPASSDDGVSASLENDTTIILVGLAEDITSYLDTSSNIQFIGEPDVNGEDIATINVSVDDNASAIVEAGLINIDILAVNDDEVAVDDNFSTEENIVITGNLFDDNGNGADFDIDSENLTVVSVAGQALTSADTLITLASGATLIINDSGAFTYDASTALDFLNLGETVQDIFTYELSDGEGDTATGQVTIDVAGNNVGDSATVLSDSSDFADAGIGNDTVEGLAGNDTINGGSGDDVLSGGAGFDSLSGGSRNDILNGGNQADNLFGGSGNDSLFADDGNDRVFGQIGNDLIEGGLGNDRLFGNTGFDLLSGGEGNDFLDGGAQADNLFGDAGNDELVGGDGFDRLFGGADNDMLDGGNGGDALFGQSGSDNLNGNEGNDQLFGGSGFDTLNGGAGDDILSGNFNADFFVFDDDFGNDIITDFDAENAFEVINLSNVTEIEDYMDLISNHLSEVDGNAVITDGDNTITLNGVSVESLSEGDFIF